MLARAFVAALGLGALATTATAVDVPSYDSPAAPQAAPTPTTQGEPGPKWRAELNSLRAEVSDLKQKLAAERRQNKRELRLLHKSKKEREQDLLQALSREPQVLHALDLAAATYKVPAARLRRIAWCESTHVPTARLGPYVGLFQFGTWLWGHSPYGDFERTDPYAASLAAAWAFSRGYDRHWPVCGKLR